MDAKNIERKYTCTELLSWPEGERWELVDGMPLLMSQPTILHEDVKMDLVRQLSVFLVGKPCRVYDAIGVKLRADEETYFVPDITVVCDKSKLADGKVCNGAPDVVIEILSPTTAGIDKLEKFNKYLNSGVREYWIVDPDAAVVNVHMLDCGKYVTTAYGKADTVPVHVLEGCMISLPDVFAG